MSATYNVHQILQLTRTETLVCYWLLAKAGVEQNCLTDNRFHNDICGLTSFIEKIRKTS